MAMQQTMVKLFQLAMGGAMGTIARYGISGATHRVWGRDFPYGTMVVNLIGCFLIGAFLSFAESRHWLAQHTRVLLIVGFTGAFTTFSSLMMETDALLSGGAYLRAVINISLSVAAGLLLFRAGIAAGRLLLQ